MKVGMPVYINEREGWLRPTVFGQENGVALTHAKLKELLKEYWIASMDEYRKGLNGLECKDFETYYQGRGNGKAT